MTKSKLCQVSLLLFSFVLPHLFGQEPERKLDLKEQQVYRLQDNAFGRLVGGVETENGDVFLLDVKQYKVFKFKENGTLLKAFAQKGEGPGDLKSPFFIAPAYNGGVWVECGLARLSVFDAEGQIQKMLNLAALDSKNIRAHVLGPDRLLCIRKTEGNLLRQEVTDFSGKNRGQFILSAPDPSFKKSGMMVTFSLRYCTTELLFASTGSAHLVARNDQYPLLLLDINGKTIHSFTRTIEPLKLSAKEIEYIKGVVRKSFGKIAEDPAMADMVNKSVAQIITSLPQHKVLFSNIALTTDHVWVFKTSNDISIDSAPIKADLFKITGEYLGEITLDEMPLFLGKNSLYFLGETEDEIVVRRCDYEIR